MTKDNLEVKINKTEYAKLAHIINSRKMKIGRNTVYTDNDIYYIYWHGFDDWFIYNFESIGSDNYENEERN